VSTGGASTAPVFEDCGTEHLQVEQRGAVAVVVLDRPEARNARSLPMPVGMADAGRAIDAEETIRCAVLTGAGGSFYAGMGLKAMGGSKASASQHRLAEDPDLHWKALLRHHRLTKPLVTAVEGHAVAGGTEILQATDIRLAAEAKQVCLIGHVVPDGEALATALELAVPVAANVPVAVEAIKRSVAETEGMSEEEGPARELEIGWPTFSTEDAAEGQRAFAEKRPPVFRRR
jgi:enoyl-CoA hydratase